MLIKNKLKRITKGFTLLETIIATGIASVILTSALSVLASIYFSQKKVQFSHDFFAEARFLMERISQVTRNNTLDYDRYFIEYGPSASCSAFNVRQIPSPSLANNNMANRAELSYANIFYWDTDPTPDGIQDRNLGGKLTNGTTNDPCTRAFDETVNIDRLYLINSARNMRIEVRHEAGPDFRVSMRRQLGADTTGDGVVDTWGPEDINADGDIEAGDLDVDLVWTGSQCQILVNDNGDSDYADTNESFPIAGDSTTESLCDEGHETEIISPMALRVDDLSFQPSPAFDPYLAFRNNQAQVHPQVFISLNLSLRNPDAYGFEVDESPTIDFQTMVSSRVFGNIRR
jgi:type II secretory pathway pseudopilin PulG